MLGGGLNITNNVKSVCSSYYYLTSKKSNSNWVIKEYASFFIPYNVVKNEKACRQSKECDHVGWRAGSDHNPNMRAIATRENSVVNKRKITNALETRNVSSKRMKHKLFFKWYPHRESSWTRELLLSNWLG